VKPTAYWGRALAQRVAFIHTPKVTWGTLVSTTFDQRLEARYFGNEFKITDLDFI